MKANKTSIDKDHIKRFIKDLFIALCFSSFALVLLLCFEIFTRN